MSWASPRRSPDAAPNTPRALASTGGWRICVRAPAPLPPPAYPLGDPRRHPRSAPRARLRHHLLATTAQQVTPSGVVRLLTRCGCKDRDLRAESHRQPPVLRHGQRAHRVGEHQFRTDLFTGGQVPHPHRPDVTQGDSNRLTEATAGRGIAPPEATTTTREIQLPLDSRGWRTATTRRPTGGRQPSSFRSARSRCRPATSPRGPNRR